MVHKIQKWYIKSRYIQAMVHKVLHPPTMIMIIFICFTINQTHKLILFSTAMLVTFLRKTSYNAQLMEEQNQSNTPPWYLGCVNNSETSATCRRLSIQSLDPMMLHIFSWKSAVSCGLMVCYTYKFYETHDISCSTPLESRLF